MAKNISIVEARLRALEAEIELLRERERRHEAEIALLNARPNWIPWYPVYSPTAQPYPFWQIPNYVDVTPTTTCSPPEYGNTMSMASVPALLQ